MFSLKVDNEIELGLFEVKQAPTLFALVDQNREYLREWLPWLDATTSVEDTKTFIKGALQQFAENNGFQAGIWYKGELAGTIGFHYVHWVTGRTEIGYWLGKNHEGHGIMTRATRKLVEYAFNDLGLNRVEIRCATGNHKSRAIPERLGFTREGTLRQVFRNYDQLFDIVVYGMLAGEWGSSS